MGFATFFASRGGQLFSLYLLILGAMAFSAFDHQTGVTILNMLIGALLRDMQDERLNPSK